MEEAGNIVDLYPSPEEILAKDDLKCSNCLKEFMNISALKLHQVKKHRIINTAADRRIYERLKEYISTSYIYHCPSEPCMEKNVKFVGLNNLRQHYYRVHGEKNALCDLCDKSFALQKDLDYHKKARCPNRPVTEQDKNDVEKKKKAPKKSLKRKAETLQNKPLIANVPFDLGYTGENSLAPSTSSQPIIIIVPTENVAATIEQLSKSLRTTQEASVQVQTVANENMFMPQTTTIAVGAEQPESYDFGGQFDSIPNSSDVGDYYYNSNQNADVRHISTGTDFSLPPYMDISMEHNMEQQQIPVQNYHQSAYHHQTTNMYQQEPCKPENYGMTPYCDAKYDGPSRRSMGTDVDESLFNGSNPLGVGSYRHVATGMDEGTSSMINPHQTSQSEAPSNSHIHTQTFWE